MTLYVFTLFSAAVLAIPFGSALAGGHFDIAPRLENSRLLTGGLDHLGNQVAPPVHVYGYEFGEEPLDPFNVSDPGVNQVAGVGNLPAGGAMRYNILSGLLFWAGAGPVQFAPVSGDTRIALVMGASTRTLTGSSGPQAGSLVQTVTSTGVVHKHFTTQLLADDTHGNVPGEPDFLAPPDGIYAFSIELTLTEGANTYVSDPVWLVFNNGLTEQQHVQAMAAVPEPASLGLLAIGGLALLQRRRRMV